MKRCLVFVALFFILLIPGDPAGVASMSGGSGDDVADLMQSLETYIDSYLPGIGEEAKTAIMNYTEDGLKNEKDRYFMPLMSTLANIRKAGQSGESEGITDVINDYNRLSEEAGNNVITYLTGAFEGIYLKTAFEDGSMTVSRDSQVLANIRFNTQALSKEEPDSSKTSQDDASKDADGTTGTPSGSNTAASSTAAGSGDKAAGKVKEEAPSQEQEAIASGEDGTTGKDSATGGDGTAGKDSAASGTEPAAAEEEDNYDSSQGSAPSQAMLDAAESGAFVPDVTTTYFTAYLPGVPKEYIEKTKALIKTYSDNGGGPAGSGALWRCIREIGEIMGREVEMAPDYSSFEVLGEGETEFMNLSEEQKEQVIAKVKEGMTGIAVTASYEGGVFTFTKLGEVQFAYTVKNAPADTAEEETGAGTGETASRAPEDASSGESGEESGNAVILWAGITAVLIAAGVAGFIIYRKRVSSKNKIVH